MKRDIFQAIADPNRRSIIGLLARRQLTQNGIAEQFDISRPAISKHIKILIECGLVKVSQEGRERYCEAHIDKLSEVSEWIERYRKLWVEKFDALETCLGKLQRKEKRNERRKRNARRTAIE